MYSSSPPPANPHDEWMCLHSGMQCLDLSWTKYLLPADFADDGHNLVPVLYGDINVQFLELLRTGEHVLYSLSALRRTLVTLSDTEPPLTLIADSEGLLHVYQPGVGSLAFSAATKALHCTAGESDASSWPREEHSAASLMHHVLGAVTTTYCTTDLKEGSLLRMDSERAIFLVEQGARREFQSFKAFVARGFDTDQVQVLTQKSVQLAFYRMPLGPPIT